MNYLKAQYLFEKIRPMAQPNPSTYTRWPYVRKVIFKLNRKNNSVIEMRPFFNFWITLSFIVWHNTWYQPMANKKQKDDLTRRKPILLNLAALIAHVLFIKDSYNIKRYQVVGQLLFSIVQRLGPKFLSRIFFLHSVRQRQQHSSEIGAHRVCFRRAQNKFKH